MQQRAHLLCCYLSVTSATQSPHVFEVTEATTLIDRNNMISLRRE